MRTSLLLLMAIVVSGIAVAQTSTATKPKTLSSKALSAAEKTVKGVSMGADKKSLLVGGVSARLVVTTGPENDMMSYRIKGLRNPTITMKPGTKLSILFVNTDEDMLHNLRFTAKAPPFDAKIGKAGSTGSSDLPHRAASGYTGQELAFVAPKRAGTYYYVCTIPGHASAGMFGKLVVKG